MKVVKVKKSTRPPHLINNDRALKWLVVVKTDSDQLLGLTLKQSTIGCIVKTVKLKALSG